MMAIIGFVIGVLLAELPAWWRDRRETRRILWRLYEKKGKRG
jgi:hypothetical protein